MNSSNFQTEVNKKQRFEFGKNWTNFLTKLTDERIQQAEISLKKMLGVDSLDGKSFLDIGSGSGLFSLAARNLGADVVSFDFDDASVSCTKTLKSRYYSDDQHWTVLQGSVLDKNFLEALTQFDIVYSWGVLHHTGEMWQAISNASEMVVDGGLLYIAILRDKNFNLKGMKTLTGGHGCNEFLFQKNNVD